MAMPVLALMAAAPVPPQDYANGQVWHYKTRPEDQDSLLRINEIEKTGGTAPARVIYHISIIGVHFHGAAEPIAIAHLPVSRETLDASVTGLATTKAPFPSDADGLKNWREAHGGVFTTPIAEILQIANHLNQSRGAPPGHAQ
jgi:hypothetical protein